MMSQDAIMKQLPFEGPSCLEGVYALGTALYACMQWKARRSILKTSSPAQELDLCVFSDDIPESDNDDCEVCLLHRTLWRLLCHFPNYVPPIQVNLCLKFIIPPSPFLSPSPSLLTSHAYPSSSTPSLCVYVHFSAFPSFNSRGACLRSGSFITWITICPLDDVTL